jgi:hypothetical protein
MESPFEMIVYDKNLEFTGFVVDPVYCNFVPSWHNQGYGSFMLASDNPHSEAVQAKGARVGVRYKGQHLMSGPIRSYRGDLAGGGEQLIYQMLDDRRLLVNTLAFVAPRHGLEATSLTDFGQAWRPEGGLSPVAGTVVGQTPYFLWPNGSAVTDGLTITSSEQAIKYIIEENLVKRLGRNVTMMPNLGRGGDPTAILPVIRQESIAEAIQPIMNFSGLSVKLWQEPYGTTIFVDVVEPGVWEQELTPKSGIINSGVYSLAAPTITRPIIGGPGETSSRVFGGIEGIGNQTQAEEDYNDVIEVFREASTFDFVWPEGLEDRFKVPKYYPFRAAADDLATFYAYMSQASATGLVDGAARASLELQLAETVSFHFGGSDGIQLGDTITVLASGQKFTNQVTEAQLVFTRDKGFTATPLVGQRSDDPDVVLARALANVATALRNLSTSK